MDHLEEARRLIQFGDDVLGAEAQPYYQSAIANALVALVERLDAMTADGPYEKNALNTISFIVEGQI